jgi:DNA-binding beta-propeller fold protein YncE
MCTADFDVYSDIVVRDFGGYLYILEKKGADNVIKFDPSGNDESGILYQAHLGDNWNSYDIDFVSETKAYIINQNEPKITVFDPSDGTVVKHIDISAYTFNPDSNVTPYANQATLCQGKLYVQLQRRNGISPGAPTMVLAVDTESDAVVDSMTCTYNNGYDMICVEGVLYVTNPGGFEIGDGGIETIDLATGEAVTLIDENALGGNPNHIVHKEGSRFYVTNYVGWANVEVLEIDVATKMVVEKIPGVVDAFGGILYDDEDGRLYVGERGAGSVGVLVYEGNKLIAGPLTTDKTLPPSGMTIVR